MTTYYVDVTTGDDSDTGLTELLAWATLEKAADTLSAGDKCWVKASASYTAEDGSNGCVMYIDSVGTVGTGMKVYEGYDSTTGDGGIVTIDGQSSLEPVNGNTLNTYYKFKNFHFTGSNDDGIGRQFRYIHFENCIFDDNAGHGSYSGFNTYYLNCMFSNNGNSGHGGSGTGVTFNSCVFHDNADYGVVSLSGIFVNCLFYNNGGSLSRSDIYVNGSAATHQYILNCTFDGDNEATHTSLFSDHTNPHPIAVINNVIYDCGYGIYSDGDPGDGAFTRNNLFINNDTDRYQFPEGEDDIEEASGDPFEGSGSADYRLTSTASAKAAGIDAGYCKAYWDSYNLGAGDNPPDPSGETYVSYIDMGAIQRAEPAGGGGGRRPRLKEHGT